jgi:TP901 family phage tail tape measure protein
MSMLLGDMRGVVTLDISDLSTKVAMATSQLSALDKAGQGSGLTRVANQLDAVGVSSQRVGVGFLGLGAALLAPMAIGIKGAINLEQAFKDVEASLGDVNEADLKTLQKSIIDVGASGQFSAIEIAAVTEELAKSGFTIEQILSEGGNGNMIKAVSDLASATGSSLQPAVEGISNAMAVWHPSIVDSSIALTDASVAADIYTVAANESKASVEDIIAGMRNFGPAAAMVGIGFDEAAASISLFTKMGLNARDAGTSLTRAITMLSDPTSEAAGWMEALSIAPFKDGKFIGLPALMDQLQKNMGHLDDKTKLAALSSIFGAEAMDVMGLSVLTGSEALRELVEMMGESGKASSQAAMRTQTLKGAIERLTEGFSTFLAVLAGGLVGPLTALAKGLDAIVNVMMSIPTPVLNAIGVLITLAGLLALAGGAAILAAPKITAFLQTLRALAAMEGGISGLARGMLGLGKAAKIAAISFGIFGAAIGLGVLAYQKNILGFADFVNQKFGWVADMWGDLTGKTTAQTETMGRNFNGMVETVHAADGTTSWFYTELDDNGTPQRLGQIIESKEDLDGDNKVEVKIKTEDGEYWTWIDLNTGEIVGDATVEVAVEEKKKGSIEKITDRLGLLQDKLNQSGHPFLADMVGGLSKGVNGLADLGGWFNSTWNRAMRFNSVFVGLRKAGVGFFKSLKMAGGYAFEPIIKQFNRLREAAGDAMSALPGLAKAALGGIVDIGKWTLDTAIPTVKGWLKKGGSTAWEGMTTAADWAWNKGLKVKNWTMNVAAPKVKGWLSRAGNTAWDGLSAAAGWGKGQAIKLKNWTMDVAKPTIGGWLRGATSGLMDIINGAVSGGRSLIANLKEWTIDTALPKITGWLSSARDGLMSLLDKAIGGAGDMIGNLRDWVLETAAPSVTGWISEAAGNVWEAVKDAVGWAGDVAGDIGSWILDTAAPEVLGWVRQAAGNAWEYITRAAGWGIGKFKAQMEEWDLDFDIPDVIGWIKDFVNDPAGELEDAVDGFNDITVELEDWTLDVAAPNVKMWMEDFNEWFLGKTGIDIGADYVTPMKKWTLEVGIPTIALVGWETTSAIADFIGGVVVGLGEAAWSLLLGNPLVVLGFDVDRTIEDALGYVAEAAITAIIDVMWAFKEDPGSSLKRTLGLLLGAGLLLSVAINGLALTLLPIALAAAAILIYRQLNDYFKRNPGKIDELKLEFGKIWAELEDGKFGAVFTGIRKIGEAVIWTVDKVTAFNDWLDGLPGPLGDAKDAVDKLVLAFIALNAVSMLGGGGLAGAPGKGGKPGKGLLAGLLGGLWQLAMFPFALIFRPVKTLQKMLRLFGRGSLAKGGRAGSLGGFAKNLGLLALAPFRAIVNGIKGITFGIGNFRAAFAKAGGGFKGFMAGLNAMWGTMKGGKNAMGRFLQKLGNFGTGLKTFGKFAGKVFYGLGWAMHKAFDPAAWGRTFATFRTGLMRSLYYIGWGMSKVFNPQLFGRIGGLFKSLGGVLATTFRNIVAQFPSLQKVFGGLGKLVGKIPGLLGNIGPLFAKIGKAVRAAFSAKNLGIIGNPKAFAAFSKIWDKLALALTKFRGPLMKLMPFLSRLAPLFRLMISPIALLSRGLIGLVPALAAIPGIGWILLAVIALVIAAFIAWKTNFLGFRDAVKAGWAQIVAGFEQIIEWANKMKDAFDAGGWSGLFNALWETFTHGMAQLGIKIWEGIQALGPIIADGFRALPGLLGDLWGWIKDTASDIDWGSVGSALWSGVQTAAAWVWDQASSLASRFWDWLKTIDIDWAWIGGVLLAGLNIALLILLGVGLETLVTLGTKIVDKIKQGAEFGWNLLKAWFGQLASWIPGAIGDLGRGVLNKGQEIFTKIKEGASFGWNLFTAWLGQLGGWVAGKIGNLAAGVRKKGEDIFTAIKAGAEAKWNEFVGWVSGLADDIVGYLGNPGALTETGIEWAQKLWSGFSGHWDAFTSWMGRLELPSMDDVLDGIQAVLDLLEDLGNFVLDVTGISGAFDGIASAAGAVVGPLETVYNKVKQIMDFFGGGDWDLTTPGLVGPDLPPTWEPPKPPENLPPAQQPGMQTQMPTMAPLIGPQLPPGFEGKVRTIAFAMDQLKTATNGVKTASTGMLTAFTPLPVAFDVGRKQAALLSTVFSTAPVAWGLPVTTAMGLVKTSFTTGMSGLAAIAGSTKLAISTQFAGLSADTGLKFGMMRAMAVQQTNSLKASVTSSMSQMSLSAAKSALQMQIQSSTHARTMNSNMIKSIHQTRTGVNSAMNEIVVNVANKMATAAAVTKNFMGQISSSMRSGAQAGLSAIRSAFSQIPGIISSSGGAAIGIARSIGANIGNALASGIESAVGRVRRAAAAIMQAANQAASAAAGIASPSKVWLGFAKNVTGTFIDYVASKSRAAGVAATDFMQAANDAFMTPEFAIDLLSHMPTALRDAFALWGEYVARAMEASVISAVHARTGGAAPTYGAQGGGNVYNSTYNDHRSFTVVQREGEDQNALIKRIAAMQDNDYDSTGKI